ncbi:MAG: hypothetical protein RR580_05275 [Christensenellaceae bacterium]
MNELESAGEALWGFDRQDRDKMNEVGQAVETSKMSRQKNCYKSSRKLLL